MQEESLMSKLDFLRSMPNLIILSLLVAGALILLWAGQITLNDMSVWNKDMGTALFGSRTGEGISLGIGMTLFNYVLIGGLLLAAGTVLFLRNRMLVAGPEQTMVMQTQPMRTRTPVSNGNNNRRSTVNHHNNTNGQNGVSNEERFFSGCIHHFGYLSSRPKDYPIPQECIICQRLGDCMVATVYVKKVNE